MIELIFAAALANSIAAPPGIWAHAQWGATRPNVRLVIENRSEVKAWLLDVTCNAYDARGALVAIPTGNLPELGPGQRATTWAIADRGETAVRFACKVGVSDWRQPNVPGRPQPPRAQPQAASAAAK
jgi:hypothetical protein